MAHPATDVEIDFNNKYDYLVVSTGYTSRLFDEPKTVGIPDYLMDDMAVAPVLLKDDLWGTREGKQFKSYTYDPTEEEDEPFEDATLTTVEDVLCVRRFLESKGLDGVIVYKNASLSDGLAIISELGEAKYCAFCTPSNVTHCHMCVFEGKKVCIIEVDCESG